MKKSLLCLTALCGAFLLVAGFLPAQEAAKPAAAPAAGPAPASELGLAAEALKKGDEVKAWQLYSENAVLFTKTWAEQDDALAAWVPDQLRKQKRYQEAQDLCDLMLAKEGALGPEFLSRVMLTKGDVFKDRENFPAAKLEYQGLEKNKELAKTEAGRKAKFRIVDILRVTKDYDTANEMLERLKDSMDAAEEAEAYYYSARIAVDREDYEAAREFIEEVKRRAPEHVETLFLEGELNLKQDRLQDPELEIGSRVLTTYVVPGRPITMKMQDRNLAIVRGGAGLPVELRTSKSGDREVVVLSPSPRDPTLFRGQLATRLGEGAASNMVLELTGLDVVTYNLDPVFQQQNDLKYPEKKMVVVANADLSATSGDFVSSEDRDEEALQRQMQELLESSETLKAYEKPQVRNTALVRPGNDIRVQVLDADRDTGSGPDSVLVDAETSSGDLVTGISLVETNAHAGIFRGKIPTTIAPPMATASDSAAGSQPGAAISAGDSAGWSSLGDGKKPKWIDVDLMTVQPLVEASAAFGGAGVKAVTLYGGVGTALDPKAVVMARMGGTRPLPAEVHGYVDLARHFGSLEKTAAYLCAEFEAPDAVEAVFKIGSCDGVVCWLNGERVHMNLGGRMWKPEEDSVKVKLQKGPNCVVLRVSQLTGPWGASLTVEDAAGKGLPSIKAYPPAKAGVITDWFLFDRPTPEDIVLPKRVSTDKPVRIGDGQFRWIPVSVIPRAHVTLSDTGAKAVFHTVAGVRRIRWSLDEFEGASVTVRKLAAKNKFGDAVLPCESDFSSAKGNRQLELGPGDRILVKYNDERNTRGAPQVLTATMNSGFNDAIVQLAYERIDTDAEGRREILYDPAVRYRPGITETLAVRVTDYDADTGDERDRVKVLAATSGGAEAWIEAIESEPHSGEFLAVLKLGGEAKDALKVGRGDKVSVSYQDRENGDGQLEKTAVVIPATPEAPEILLYQALIDMEPAPGGREGLVPVLKTRLAPKATNGLPVVTSIDTSLVFSVLYPEGALSQGSVLPVKVITERALEDAVKSGREPAYVDVAMDLAEPLDAVFSAQVTLRTGNPEDYADEMAARESARPARPVRGERRALPRLYVKADDIVKVIVKGAGQGPAKEARYRLASDGYLAFMDRKYQATVQQVYVGDYLYLQLADRDRDLTDGLDSVKVTLSAGSENREIALSETLPHSGVFAGRVRTEMRGIGAAKAAADGAETVLPVGYGESIKAVYQDAVCVVAIGSRTVVATANLYPGADGALATFTKLFADEEIAVKTRLLTAEALFELAKSHRESNQKELADKEIAEGKAILEEAIADYPNTSHAPHAEFLLANLAQEIEKFEEAITRYDKVVSNWPNSEFASRAMLRKAICQEKLNDFENALDTYVELTYSYPNSPLVSDAVIRLGQYFYRTSRFEVAGKIFSSFQERNPAHDLAAKALFLSGQSYLKGAEERKKLSAGKYDATGTAWLKEGVGRFEKLMSTYEDKDLRSESMYWTADSHMKLNDMKSAYQTFKRLTWDYPETKWAKFARGQLVQNAKAFEKFEMDQD